MNVYYLCEPGKDPVWELDNPWGASHVVRVRDGDYYGARGRALQHAGGCGVCRALVVAGQCQLVGVNRVGGAVDVTAAHPYTDHALLLYAERILRELAGAVYVEHTSTVGEVPRGWAEHRPGIPMVAAYSVNKVTLEHGGDKDLGLRLCEHGFRTVTLSDFAYALFGDSAMREQGTQKLWKRTHEKATQTLF